MALNYLQINNMTLLFDVIFKKKNFVIFHLIDMATIGRVVFRKRIPK